MQKHLQALKLTLLNIGYVPLDKSWNYDNVISPFSRMYYISEGSARVHHHDQIFDLKPGYMYLIPSYTYSRYQCDDFMKQYYVSFLEELGKGMSIYYTHKFRYEVKARAVDIQRFKTLSDLNPNRELLDSNPKDYDNRPSLLNFIEKNEQMSSSTYLETHGVLLALLSRFLVDKSTAPTKGKKVINHKIIESTYFINQNLTNQLTVEGLAERCFLNSDYYSRVFHEQMGIRPLMYIQSKRIERAQLLLATTSDSIQEIADKVGLPNVSYFSRLFKKLVGKAPGQFRTEQWKL